MVVVCVLFTHHLGATDNFHFSLRILHTLTNLKRKVLTTYVRVFNFLNNMSKFFYSFFEFVYNNSKWSFILNVTLATKLRRGKNLVAHKLKIFIHDSLFPYCP